MYNNLIYLLTVILLLTMGSVPEQPRLHGLSAILLFGAKGILFSLTARHFFRRARNEAESYLGIEQRLIILAIIFLAMDVFLLEGRHYLAKLPLARQVPTIADLAGVLVFFAYLSLVWLAGLDAYRRTFARAISAPAFIKANLKINLAILLPWLLLSIVTDLARVAPFPKVQKFIASPWGEPALVFFSLAGLVFFLPLAIIRLWGCTPLPSGAIRQRIEAFCRKEKLRFADILSWPLFEGRMLTAGVMGISSRFRYLLVTPALVRSTTPEELEAVMAHELGHVKYYHLQLYLFLFLGFALLAQAGSAPLMFILLSSEYFYRLIELSGASPDTVLAATGSTLLFAVTIIYFRFIFGFFMRNFERQADLYASAATGAAPLIMVFEKLALMGGNIRDLPSWHHFGLGQRIEFLQRSEEQPGLAEKHHRKVYLALILYTVALLAGGLALWRLPADLAGAQPPAGFIEVLIQKKIREQPQNGLWRQVLGDLRYSLGREKEAIAAYEQALHLEPVEAETLNNLAWLLLTAEDPALRDPKRALWLAGQAAKQKRAPHILDTLATAHWATGSREEAVRHEEEALAGAKTDKDYYRGQIARFGSGTYSRTTRFPGPGQRKEEKQRGGT